MTDRIRGPVAAPLQPVPVRSACGFACPGRQTRPSAYAVLRTGATKVHVFGGRNVRPDTAGPCMLMLDNVSAAHDAVAKRFRSLLGNLPYRRLQHMSRFRVAATRFTVTNGEGNAMIVTERAERDRQVRVA